MENNQNQYRNRSIDDKPNWSNEDELTDLFSDDDEVTSDDRDRINYEEETAAEYTPSVRTERQEESGGEWFGYIGLALAILSLFVYPVLFGAIAIVLGFMARRRNSTGVGSWAIGIGTLSVILGIFIAPFF